MIHSLTGLGILVPNGFATTSFAYRTFIVESGLDEYIRKQTSQIIPDNLQSLQSVGRNIRAAILNAKLPDSLEAEITKHYALLCEESGPDTEVAVRSSATAEDLPDASFAGQQDTYLCISGIDAVIEHTKRCISSLFTNRAISQRQTHGFDHLSVYLSVGIQKMVRSDLASAGVIFSIDTETGFKNAVLVTAGYGVGENVVQGDINPDEYTWLLIIANPLPPLIVGSLISENLPPLNGILPP
jgi:pyruvate,water dikinase